MYGDQYSNKKNTTDSPFDFDILSIFASICYLIFTVSILIQFIPINTSNWYNLGMGKYLGFATIFAIMCLFFKNYFAAFFISLFAAFFSFHEIIIFYDNYAIELGKELGSDGVFRSLVEIFVNEIIKQPSYGAFWAIFSSILSLFFVSLAWIKNIIIGNISLHDKVVSEEMELSSN